MATVRAGNRPVLMIVDVQAGVMQNAWDAPRIVGNVALAVARARDAGVPVVWVQHTDADLPEGSAAWQWADELAPSAGEVRLQKSYNSAFERTVLEDELAALGATHIVLAGAATNWCIRATAYAALERGYDLTLVSDGHTTETLDDGAGLRIEAATLVDDLNIAMAWVEYPDRISGTAPAATVDFHRPGGIGGRNGA